MALPDLSHDAARAFALATMRDRIIGSLVGSALGDAIGLYTEFLPASMAVESYPSRTFTLSPRSNRTPFRRDHHRAPHQTGEWTDDTDHALLILLSFLHNSSSKTPGQTRDGFAPADLAERLSSWVSQGLRPLDSLPLGLGRTVGAIVRTKTYLDDPEAAARSHWTKCGYNAAPNGSLMRTHPLGLICAAGKSREATLKMAAAFSEVTHVDRRCIASCVAGTELVRGLVRGEVNTEEDVDDVLREAMDWTQKYRAEGIERDSGRKEEPELVEEEFWRHAKVDSLEELGIDEMGKIGYVYKTFGSGVHLLRLAMRRIKDKGDTLLVQKGVFEELVTDLVMRGGDADTNACFAGALLGGYLGYGLLPPAWRDGLVHGEWLMGKAEALCSVLGIGKMDYDGVKDKDTAIDGGKGLLTNAQLDERAMVVQARMVAEEQEWKRKEKEREKARKKWFEWK